MSKKIILFLLIFAFFSTSLISQYLILKDEYDIIPVENLKQEKIKKITHIINGSKARKIETLLRKDGQNRFKLTTFTYNKDTARNYYFYSANGLLLKEFVTYNNTDTISKTQYEYNKNKNLQKEITLSSLGKKEIEYIYNGNDEISKSIHKSIYNKKTIRTQSEYNKNGKPTQCYQFLDHDKSEIYASFEYLENQIKIHEGKGNSEVVTIIELNKKGFPLSRSKSISQAKDIYVYYENGLIKSIGKGRKPNHYFEYEKY